MQASPLATLRFSVCSARRTFPILLECRRSFCSGFEGAGEAASLGTDLQFVELLSAAKRGRMDIAFKLAKPLIKDGETPTQFVARECSNRAARSWTEGREEREKAVNLAVSGATFYLPLRGAVQTKDLGTHYWSKQISSHYERADSVFKLCRASLALRGLESMEAVERLEQQCLANDPGSRHEATYAARDLQVMSQAIVTKLQTSRSSSVLQAFVAKAFMEDTNLPVRCPILFQLMLKAGTHFTAAFTEDTTDGPLETPDDHHPCPPLKKRVEDRQAAVLKHMQIIAEITSEASTSLLTDAKEGLALLMVAESFFKEECPLAERRKAMVIFESTTARLRDRLTAV